MLNLLVSFTLFAVALGQQLILPSPPKSDGRIVGGVETTIGEFPYQVSVLHIFRHTCGGSIINENTVITAAHCTEGRRPFTIQVRAGSSYRDNNKEPGNIYNVDKIIQHPDFSFQTVDYDIAILKLKQNIVYTKYIQPIPLQAAGVDVPVNKMITVTGWGFTQEGVHGGSSVLRKESLARISDEQCNINYGSKITKNMFCAQGPMKDACQGDSGGPAAYNGHLVGIVSWGIGCARPQYPGVFTRISALRSWIDENIDA